MLAYLLRPLTEALKGKPLTLIWNLEMNQFFAAAKSVLANVPTLVHSDPFDHELFAVYFSLYHFCFMLEGKQAIHSFSPSVDSGAGDFCSSDSGSGDSGSADSGTADSRSADSSSADSGSADSGSVDSNLSSTSPESQEDEEASLILTSAFYSFPSSSEPSKKSSK